MKAHIDFETRSGANLKKIGAFKYAEHPSTDIMCLGIGWNDEPAVVMGVCLTRPFVKGRDASHAEWLRLLEHIQSGGEVAAHNAAFELAIWNNVGVRKYGWPVLKPEQLDCTMARAYAMSLPGALDGARAAVGMTMEKDMAGHRLMTKMCQPKATVDCPFCNGPLFVDPECSACSGTGSVFTWHEEPDQIDKLFGYCGRDIEVERGLDKRIMKLTPLEKKVWVLDYKINSRGMHVDVENAVKAAALVEKEGERLDAKMREVTGGEVLSCKANVRLTEWICSEGVSTEGVAKDDVAKLLAREDLPSHVRKAVELRKEAAKTSTAKLEKMFAVAGSDQRLRGMFQYNGANTGRWAARIVQLHNMPRPTIEQDAIDEIFNAIETMTPDDARSYIEMFHGSPLQAISDCLRGFLCAPKGRTLAVVDKAAIEARVTAWLAGQDDILQVFRTHGKIYEAAAGKTYRVPWETISKKDPRRQVGKAEILAFGFGGGVSAVQKICKGNNIRLEPACDELWKLADDERRDRVLKRYASERTKALDDVIKGHDPAVILQISKKEWIASELLKLSYREENPYIVRYWADIEKAAVSAVAHPGKVFRVGSEELPSVRFVMKGSFLLCELPSGRRLVYPYPELRDQKTPWGETKPQLTYKTEGENRHWLRTPTYGGSLTENVVQAVARDLLAEAMIRVDDAGYEIVIHVHDEIGAEIEDNFETNHIHLANLEKIICMAPAWASGLPLATEGWSGRRYRK